MADISELVIQIRATAEGLEATIQNASQLVQKFVQEAEAATGKPFKVDVQTDSLREAVSGMIGLEEKAKDASKAGTLLKASLLDIGTSIASGGLTLLLDLVVQGIVGIINAAAEAKKKQEELRQEAIKSSGEMARKHSDTAQSIRDLGDEYAGLAGKIRYAIGEAGIWRRVALAA